MKARIKVKRAELIKAVEGRIRKLEAEHKRAVEQLPAKVAAWQKDVTARLQRAADEVACGKDVAGKYGRLDLPTKPTVEPLDGQVCRMERVLKTLKIGAEETVALSPDDADDYFGPCQLHR